MVAGGLFSVVTVLSSSLPLSFVLTRSSSSSSYTARFQKRISPLYVMPLRLSIDDRNTTLIEYEGAWSELLGSSRQWESSVHSTIEPGASARFRFRGYQVWVWGTIPTGTGNNSIDISIDSGSQTRITRNSNGSAVYNEPYFESSLLQDTFHDIVVTNRGSSGDGNTEFMLDRFEFETSEDTPLFTPTGTTISASSTYFTTQTSAPTAVSSSGGSRTPVGAITGAIIGVLVVIILVLGYFLWKRRRRHKGGQKKEEQKSFTQASMYSRSPLQPTPFHIGNDTARHTSQQASTSGPILASEEVINAVQISEKARYLQSQQLIAGPGSGSNDEIESHGNSVRTGSVAPLRTLPSSTSLPTSTAPLSPNNNNASSSIYTSSSHHDTSLPRHTHTLSETTPISINSEPFDSIPPPSYWQNDETHSYQVGTQR